MDENKTATEEKPLEIPFFSHEAEISRLERIIKRLWISGLIIFAAFVISNLIWLRYEMNKEEVVTVEQHVDTAGSPAYVNGTGELIVYGDGTQKQGAGK